MKKQVILLIITILIALSSISQNTTDTIKLPSNTLLNVIDALERGKVADQELILTKNKVEILQSKIAFKDSIIVAYIGKDSVNVNMVKAYHGLVVNYQATIKNMEESFIYKEKIIRRQKTAKWLTLAAGLTAGYFIYAKH
jgi:hypothetical protein